MATLTATIKAEFEKDHERHLHEVGCYTATFIKGHEHLRAEHYDDPASVNIINQWWNDRTKCFHEELRNLWETLTEGNVKWNLFLEQRKAEEGTIDVFSKSVAYRLNLPAA